MHFKLNYNLLASKIKRMVPEARYRKWRGDTPWQFIKSLVDKTGGNMHQINFPEPFNVTLMCVEKTSVRVSERVPYRKVAPLSP